MFYAAFAPTYLLLILLLPSLPEPLTKILQIKKNKVFTFIFFVCMYMRTSTSTHAYYSTHVWESDDSLQDQASPFGF